MIRCLVDVLVAGTALVLLAPSLLAIALWLRASGTSPVLHAEARVGRGGRLFRIHKFRTLRTDEGPPVAAANDPRVTRAGRFLRRWRLDELPQLADVVRGAMSLVGPRPQQPVNLEALDATTRAALQQVRPGLTGPAAIEFLAEDEALAEVDDPVAVYARVVLPAKARLEVAWLARRSFASDLRIVLLTATRLFSRRARARSLERIRSLIIAAPT